eukprot:CAMPEP_0198295174 /NCGR_PEP_ID=MMETSP1449-20131203/26318_1 /TAXON_ID=420275 /ORGANISM="Attheya septentrionalis, Strain CCMP2084" /LENGTH=277 /DNA_ID=CAMNT_0043995387 /DNA_START=21 /DNA_END=851 /DNA_ORIENTATION=-
MATIISPRNFPDSKDVENHSPASSNQKPRNKRANSKKGLKNSTDQNRNNENSNGQSIDSRNPNQVGGDIKKNKSRPKKKNQNAMRDKGQMSKVRETRDANGQVIQPVNKPNKNKRRNNRRKRKAQITATSPTNITATSPTNLKVVHGINLQDFITKAEEKNKSAEKIRAIVSPKVDVANVTDLHCDEELKIESPVPVKVTNNGHAVFMNALATEVAEMALASPSPVETRQEFDFEQMESVRAIKSFVTESVASDEAVRGISESLLVMETIPDEPVAV